MVIRCALGCCGTANGRKVRLAGALHNYRLSLFFIPSESVPTRGAFFRPGGGEREVAADRSMVRKILHLYRKIYILRYINVGGNSDEA